MNQSNRLYRVGPHSILLPPGHMLDQYQRRWKRYDYALGEIGRLIRNRKPEYSAIDIGANIGDTAALLCKYGPVPVLCIEGNPGFVSLLRVNAARLGEQIEIEECFIGSDGHTVDLSRIEESRGTASLIGVPTGDGSGRAVPMKSLGSIIAAHPRFANAGLIKTDTDGFDFQILSGSLDVLCRLRPVLFFEYDPSFTATGETEALRAINDLFSAGYTRYLIYDNYGNFLFTAHEPERFVELNTYLRSNKKNGCAVYYFDVCAFLEDDSELLEEIRSFELSV
jgi:FkbM family methyltransferase